VLSRFNANGATPAITLGTPAEVTAISAARILHIMKRKTPPPEMKALVWGTGILISFIMVKAVAYCISCLMK